MKRATRWTVGVAAMIAVAGCGSDSSARNDTIQIMNASYSCTVPADNGDLGNDFTGNYLWVHGIRSTPVDAKYPCLNEFTECVPFEADGATAPIEDLCPSLNTPVGTWTFEFYMSTVPGCGDAMENIACPVVSGETLAPGENHDVIACTTQNAQKDFRFCIYDPITGAGLNGCEEPP